MGGGRGVETGREGVGVGVDPEVGGVVDLVITGGRYYQQGRSGETCSGEKIGGSEEGGSILETSGLK